MAQRDSQLVIRARDEASKALQAITKALGDFVSAQSDTAKVSGATSGTLAKLGESLANLGRSATALTGVSKIAAQLERGQAAVANLETKLAQASAEFTQFQARAAQASEAATALAAKSEAAAVAEKAQTAVVKALGEAHAKTARDIKGEEAALEKLAARMAKAGPTQAPAMEQTYQSRTAALDAQRVQQDGAKAKLDAERAALEQLVAARKAANDALAGAEREQARFAASAKTAQGNIENLTAGLERSRGTLGEIKTAFDAGAKAAGLSNASVEALAEKQDRLRAATAAATAVIEAQSRAEGAAASAARAAAFQAALKTAAPPLPEPDVSGPVRARGVLAREADRQRAATEAAASSDARERVQLDALGKSLDSVARSRSRASSAAVPAAGVGAAPGVSPLAPGAGVVATTAAATTALYREQVRAVETASTAFETARARLTELHREMAATGSTTEQTAAIATQRVVVEAAQAALERETKQLEAFQQAVRAAASARREATQAADEARRAQLAANVAGTQPLPGALGEDRAAKLSAATPIGPAAAAVKAYRDQVAAVNEANDAFLRAQVTLKRSQLALTDLYHTQATAGSTVAGLTEAIAEQRAAIELQRRALDEAGAAAKREAAALSELRAPITENIELRKQAAAATVSAANASKAAALAEANAAIGARAAAVRSDEITKTSLLQRVIEGVTTARQTYNATITEETGGHNALISNLKNLAGAYVTVFTAIGAFKSVVSTAADTEAAQVRIATALGGSQEQGAIAYEHAASAARALKLDILPTVDAYGKLLAVVKDTPLEGTRATRVFDDLLVTIRAFKLAPDAMSRVTLALTDMAARGNIARKELNQLDLALPVGLRQALASAAGYGANQMEAFNKAIHDGRIGLDLLVPALDAVADRARGGLGNALNTAQSSFAAFRNALFDFKNSIAEGGFMQGVTEAVNALTAVIRDPAASEGLRGLATGFGRILSSVALVVPYVRELFIALSAFTAVKLVSMVVGFQTIYQVVGSIAVLIRTAFSGAGLLSFAATLTTVEGGLVAIGAALTGPLGIALAVASIGGLIAYWVTGTQSAESALNSYRQSVDRLKDALKENNGSLAGLSDSKVPGGLTLSDIEDDVRKQRRAYADSESALKGYVTNVKQAAAEAKTVFGSEFGGGPEVPTLVQSELDKVKTLAESYKSGVTPILEFRHEVEELNKSLTTDEAKQMAGKLSALADESAQAAKRTSEFAGAAQNAGSKLTGLEEDVHRMPNAFSDMRSGINQTDEALKEGIRALDAYSDAMDRMAGRIPGLKEKLELKKSIDEAKKDLGIELNAIETAFGAGLLSPQQEAAKRQAAIEREALDEAAAQAKEYLKAKNTPEQITSSQQYLLSQRAPGVAAESVTGLNPTFAVQLADSLKELEAKGITLKVTGGLLAGGTDATPAVESAAALIKQFEGFISAAKIDSDGKYRVGYGSDTTTSASGKVSAVTSTTTTTEEDAQRDLARRVVEFQDGAAKDIGAAWTSLADNVKASITSVAYNYGHVPSSVVAAAKTGDNITISEAIAALTSNEKRRAQEAANVTAVPGSALGGANPTIQNFGGGATLSGITDQNAQQVADALSRHFVFVPHGDNVAQLGPVPLEENPGLLAALQQAKRAGDTTKMYDTLSPPGQAKADLAKTQADESKARNDAQAANDSAEKELQTAKELLDTEKARDSVDKGMADYRNAHPGASQADLNTEQKRLLIAQSEAEVAAEVQKYRDQHPPASTDAADVATREKEIAEYKSLREQLHATRLERTLDNLAAKDTTKTAAGELAQLNALVATRKQLVKEQSFAIETGDTAKLDQANQKLTKNKSEIEQVTADLRKMYEEMGGTAGATGLANLDKIAASLENARSKVQIFGLSVKQTEELANDFVSSVTSGVDTFAQEISDGIAPIQALGDAFRQFASDFLKQLADMIIKIQLFKLLGLNESGTATGGGLLGSLSSVSSTAATASTSGGGLSSIFSWLGGLFGIHHEGGIVGQATTMRNVSPLVFAGAARYHTGGVVGLGSDEIPIIAKRNEEVLTQSDPRHRDNGGMAVNNIVKQPKIINLFDAPTFLSAALGAPEGEQAIMNYVRANSGAIKAALGG